MKGELKFSVTSTHTVHPVGSLWVHCMQCASPFFIKEIECVCFFQNGKDLTRLASDVAPCCMLFMSICKRTNQGFMSIKREWVREREKQEKRKAKSEIPQQSLGNIRMMNHNEMLVILDWWQWATNKRLAFMWLEKSCHEIRRQENKNSPLWCKLRWIL